jgi:hypothetical protein
MNLKIIGKLFMSKFVGIGPSSYKKRIYWATVSQSLRNTTLDRTMWWNRFGGGFEPVVRQNTE